MAIKTLMLIFIIFLLALAYNLWTHRNRKFLIYSPNENLNLRSIMIITAVLLVLISITGIIIMIVGSKESNFITLILGSVVAAGFSIYLANIGR
ncbi:hypothetical protein BTM29_11160 [Companilactobacillus allii]|uniref:Uncharacterized protein n=2 Tax=Companilactobacillus allii TaxID=1847728 RepID=A0A1P8Q5F4_9LACO|nr:hypothetical protein [Companilactobacillus allii]APX73073.1 hypothetical protein BTM29_11160 [Companilactobacillus allii]